jgi:Flp pilus assembly protein TadD
VVILAAALLFASQAAEYELTGRIEPPAPAAVTVAGATNPFTTSTLADAAGSFRVKGLRAGTYTVAAFRPGSGEARQTVEIGPGTADRRRRVEVTIRMDDSRVQRDSRHGTVSARELAIPERARREYSEALKLLGRRDTDGAVKRLERAVELAPAYTEAWNHLGTIAYQSRRFPQAEEHFRRALETDPGSYSPLVNLGGVLLTELKLEEALKYNIFAVLARPTDALANSQLGLTYFHLNRFDLAEKYLQTAVKLDPAHFSLPQLTLAEIHLRRGEREKAADDLEDFLARHPDWHAAAKMREAIRSLRSGN